MLKLLIKLALAGLIANAAWRMGSTYLSFYRFKDAVSESALDSLITLSFHNPLS